MNQFESKVLLHWSAEHGVRPHQEDTEQEARCS